MKEIAITRSFLVFGFMLIAVSLASGCANFAASSHGMIVYPQESNQIVALKNPEHPLRENISSGAVSGGEGTNPRWTSAISDSGFQEALKQSLIWAGLFSSNGEYSLEAELLNVEQPIAGFDMTVKMTVSYALKNRQNGEVVYQTVVVSEYTATVSDAVAALDRLRLANEGSVRENIKALLRELGEFPDAKISFAG